MDFGRETKTPAPVTPPAKTRPKMAKMRPKIAKMRPKMAKMRPNMAKMRPKIAKMRPKMAKMKAKWSPQTEMRRLMVFGQDQFYNISKNVNKK